MDQLIPFFIVLFTALFFSEVFKRLHLPWVVALILGGIVIGPYGFGFLEPNQTIDFLGQIGLVFLMFIAGLETKLPTFKESKRDIGIVSFVNSFIPFLIGLLMGYILGFDVTATLLLGIVFLSSSVAIVIPVFESLGMLGTKIGRTIVASVIVHDLLSLVLLSLLLQSVAPTRFSLPVFLSLLVILFAFFRFIIPKVQWLIFLGREKVGDVFQQELRAVFVILLAIVIAFEFLELHPIVSGFIAGILLSDVITTQALKDKLQTISYGLFIPIFFVVVGSQTDISVFWGAREVIAVAIVIALSSIFSKFLSGYLAGRFIGYKNLSSFFIGVSSAPSISTILAIVFTGTQFGLINEELSTALVILTMVVALISPILVRIVGKKVKLAYGSSLD